MLLQACLNGSRRPGDHPALPLTAAELAADARQVVEAGARALHVHPRGPDGTETLEPSVCDEALLAIRHACPAVPVGLSTASWIEPDPARRDEMIGSWTERPDFVSVNFGEPDAIELCRRLREVGIGIEAGVWTLSDAESFLDSGFARHVVRVLVEPQDVDPVAAEATADRISIALDRADVMFRVYHGNGRATWRVIEYAFESGWDVRVGLEDTLTMPDSTRAVGNTELVKEVMAMARDRHLV
ncbi:MAG TPA: 3-keto-5-aminohexanoate cleavage protein [Candidatus Dormibacteraeota bacterium]